MKELFVILLSAMLTDNFVLAKFMGICPFLGVSKKLDSATGMGIAVTFVMICATAVTYPIHHGILVPNGLEYFDTVVFILVCFVCTACRDYAEKVYSGAVQLTRRISSAHHNELCRIGRNGAQYRQQL